MGGTVYFYYDKILAVNCRLRTLKAYTGVIPRCSAVQLIIYPQETEGILQAPSGRIVADGDFYLAALSEEIVYQIHKSGMLIRAYASGMALVEETIMDVPMAVLAALQGKLLLHGAAFPAGDSVYGVLGDVRRGNVYGLPDDNLMLVAGEGEEYLGVVRSFPGDEAAHSLRKPRIPRLKGIIALQSGAQKRGLVPIEGMEDRKRILLENYAGIAMFLPELRQRITDSGILDGVSKTVPMAYLNLPESDGRQEIDREKLLELLKLLQ